MEISEPIKLDPTFFLPSRLFDRSFNEPMISKEIKDSKGIKVGKCLASQNNVGTAIFDMPRLYKNGTESEYFIDGRKVIMWQPAWLKLIDEDNERDESAEMALTKEEEEELKKMEFDFKI